MTQMATVGQVQAHKSVMGSHQGLVDLQVGRASTKALDIDAPFLRVEVECLEGSSLAGQLEFVDMLVSAVVTSSGVSLRVLVRHGRAQSVKDRSRGHILRGNEQDGLPLALDLFLL